MRTNTRLFRAKWLLMQSHIDVHNLRCTAQQLRSVVKELRLRGYNIHITTKGRYEVTKVQSSIMKLQHYFWVMVDETKNYIKGSR